MSHKGHKGAIGLSGNATYPDWVLDIVKFRNDQYEADMVDWGYLHGDIDSHYDSFDNAINRMMTIHETQTEQNRTPYARTGMTDKDIENESIRMMAWWILKHRMNSFFVNDLDISIEDKRLILRSFGFSTDVLDNGSK